MGHKVWDKTDDDVKRAYASSVTVARQAGLAADVLRFCRIDRPESPSDLLYDGSVVGLDFSRSPDGLDAVTFRIIGPIWDRWIVLRFTDVLDFESERSNLFNIGEIYWLEFFLPREAEGAAARFWDDLPDDAIGCNLYTLGYLVRHTVIFRGIEVEARTIPRQKVVGDFRVTDSGEWVLR